MWNIDKAKGSILNSMIFHYFFHPSIHLEKFWVIDLYTNVTKAIAGESQSIEKTKLGHTLCGPSSNAIDLVNWSNAPFDAPRTKFISRNCVISTCVFGQVGVYELSLLQDPFLTIWLIILIIHRTQFNYPHSINLGILLQLINLLFFHSFMFILA